jgi:hypothetical protein
MPRRRNSAFSIAQLQNLLLQELRRERQTVAQRLAEIDRQLGAFGGDAGPVRMRMGRPTGSTQSNNGSGGRGRRGRRAGNGKSLVATMRDILTSAGKPMPVADIVDKVKATGYRSNSANFRAIVNQTLIKDKGFTSAGRGVYTLK